MAFEKHSIRFWLSWMPTFAILEPARFVVFANLVQESSTDLPLLLILGSLRRRSSCTSAASCATHSPDSDRPNPRPWPRVLPLCPKSKASLQPSPEPTCLARGWWQQPGPVLARAVVGGLSEPAGTMLLVMELHWSTETPWNLSSQPRRP